MQTFLNETWLMKGDLSGDGSRQGLIESPSDERKDTHSQDPVVKAPISIDLLRKEAWSTVASAVNIISFSR